MSLYQVLRKWNTGDEIIKILLWLIAEIKKFHDEDKIMGNINPFDLYVNIFDEQVTVMPSSVIDSDWKWSCNGNRNTQIQTYF